MISFNSSCLRSRPHILLRSQVSLTPVNVLSRSSSLSAIHRGLRKSEKSRPQGFDPFSSRSVGSRNPPKRPDFKITKGKKDITYDGPGPKSRKARFHDPDEPFGKKSLVYQLKAATKPGGKWSAGGGSDRMSPDQFMKDFHGGSARSSRPSSFSNARDSRTVRNSSRTRQSREREKPWSLSRPADSPRTGQSQQRERPWSSSRPSRSPEAPSTFSGRDSTKSTFDKKFNKPYEQRDFAKSAPDRNFDQPFDKPFGKSFEKRDSIRMRSPDRPTHNRWASREDQGEKEERNYQPSRGQAVGQIELKDHDKGPIRIPRTTAASQFLYGRSVVEPALKQTTRKLYKLYLYFGENRQDDTLNIGLQRKAKTAGIPVVEVIDSHGLRRMDKMSEGRPHNGCVLEASPLPQLPVKHLGSFSEEEKGFLVTLGHQSVEEAQINGTDNFIKCNLPPNRNPFVLLLDRIQDPGNLGSILRTAAFLGVDAVGITKGYSATLNSIASKASAGASERIKLFSVDSILDFLTSSKAEDWAVYAAVAPTDRPRGGQHLTLDRLEMYDPLSTTPTILVVGSEGEGLSKDTRRLADFEVSIPNQFSSSVVDSLNVSVATGVLCSAFLKNQYSGSKWKVIEPKENETGSESESLW
ncbi:uncharacterized protein F4807DRAFT_446274 [Annulohypoxylon truncatum]|uniref:uncharacterized protein n=1 Tax=Annulohypoxylon truncatum TaxID=327061 RepID=UPI0020078082|nr:uncharacterized protein F4807DRAFT_446274 [Annulohypoxylon truncatum]KAI1204670.1 hypothetical protein F4807DRAFT_446274 [Annulohypoxylon truncatum]